MWLWSLAIEPPVGANFGTQFRHLRRSKQMAQRKATLERLNAFSDGVFSIIITILVLELNPPQQTTFTALLALWPTGVSYVVSYLFVAIVWVNHHHVLQYAEAPTARLIQRNFGICFRFRSSRSRPPGWLVLDWLEYQSHCKQEYSSS